MLPAYYMKDLEKQTQQLYEVLHTLGKKRSLELLALAKKAPRSYTELQRELGINSKLVSTKIKELMHFNILKKEWDKYDLSKYGRKLYKKIKPLAKTISEFAEDIIEDMKDDWKRNHSNTKSKTQTKIKTTNTKATTTKTEKTWKTPTVIKKPRSTSSAKKTKVAPKGMWDTVKK